MTWKGERNRHSLASRGISTTSEPYTKNWHKQFSINNLILDRHARNISRRSDVLSESEIDNMIGIVTHDLELADNLLAIKEGNGNEMMRKNVINLFKYDKNINIRDIRSFINNITKDEIQFMYDHCINFVVHS